jgi:hypothetical protein
MVVNVNAGDLTPSGAWKSIASRLAPTGAGACYQKLIPIRRS